MKNGIKKTVECDSYMQSIYAFIIVDAGFLLFIALISLPLYFDGNVDIYAKIIYIFSMITIAFSGPFIIYYVCRVIAAISFCKKAKTTEVKLERGENAYRNYMSFSINIADNNGVLQEKKNYRWLYPRTFVKYMNKTVKIYYSDEDDYFFIIKEK